MTRPIRVLLAGCVLTALVCGRTHAQNTCDLNSDGIVDAFEAGQCGQTTPAGTDPCDLNRDGIVDGTEKQQCGQPPPTTGADPCDFNGDGVVDATEAGQCGQPPPLAGGDPCDSDNDGIVDAFEASQCGQQPPTTGADPCDLNSDGITDPEEAEKCGQQPIPGVDYCDFNGDGVVDPQEAEDCGQPPSPEITFDQWKAGPDAVDLNDDGQIDHDDFHKFQDMHAPGPFPSFDEWLAKGEGVDHNGDGAIDLRDWEEVFGLAPGVDPCDFNNDGIIDPEEAEKCGQQPIPGADYCDFNGDGAVDPEEAEKCGLHPEDGHREMQRGIVDFIEVDDFGGTLALAAGEPVALLPGYEIWNGETGQLAAEADLEPGEWIGLAGHYGTDNRLVAVRLIALRGDPPGRVLHTTWAPFGGFTTLSNGQKALARGGSEYSLAYGARAVRGPDREEIPIEEVRAGARVEIAIQHGELGQAVVEIHLDPPDFAEPGMPGEPPPEPYWDRFGRIGHVNADFRTVRFLFEPMRLAPRFEVLDEFGGQLDLTVLERGSRVVALQDVNTGEIFALHAMDPERDYGSLFDDPAINPVFGVFVGIEDDHLVLMDDYGDPVAVDVRVSDEKAETDLTGAVRLEDLTGEFVRATVRSGSPDSDIGQVIVEIARNPVDAPLAPGERPTPTEFYGEWHGDGTIGEIDLDNGEIAFSGVRVILDGTDITGRDGISAGAGALQRGDWILVDAIPTLDPGVVVARSVTVDPVHPPEGFAPPLFTTSVLRVEGGELLTAAGIWPLLDEIHALDELTGQALALTDLQPGDVVRFVVQQTDVGDIIGELIRNPKADHPFDESRTMDAEIAFVGERGLIQAAGPLVRFLPDRTPFLDARGNTMAPADIAPNTPIVVDQVMSATGGPPLARSVEIQSFERHYDLPDLLFTGFGHIEGDVIVTVDPNPRPIAEGAEIVFGDGRPAGLDDLAPGVRVRMVILQPRPGMPWIGDVVTRIVIDPERGDEPIDRPVEEGEAEGVVVDVNLQEGFLVLEGPIVKVDLRTEILGVGREKLRLEDLAPGDLVAINFYAEPEFLRATKLGVLDPFRPLPEPRPDLLVSPIGDIDVTERLLFIEGPFGFVTATTRLHGTTGEPIGLENVQIGDLVRFHLRDTAGEPVVDKLQILGGFEGPVFHAGGIEIVSTFPAPGDVGVETEVVELTFSEQIFGLLDEKDFDIVVFPAVDFGLDVSRDGRTLILRLAQALAEDTVYEVGVISPRFGLFTMMFSTGDAFPSGEILGRINLPPEIPFSRIALESSGVVLLGIDAVQAGEFDPKAMGQRVTLFEPDGSYHFGNVPDGEYTLYAFIALEFAPGEELHLDAFLLDNLGEISSVQVSGGLVDRVDLSILPPEPFEVAEIIPADADTDVDLESTLSVRLTEELRLDDRGLPLIDIEVVPTPESGPVTRDDFAPHPDDPMIVSTQVKLAPDARYTVLVRRAESVDGLRLEEPATASFSTGAELPGGAIAGRISLPSRLAAERVILPPATIWLVPYIDFDASDPRVRRFAVAGTLTMDGRYQIDHVPDGRYAIVAAVDVALPPGFRVSRTAEPDFAAFDAAGRFGQDAPDYFVKVLFAGFSRDSAGQVRDDVRPGAQRVDIELQPEDVRKVALRVEGVQPEKEALLKAPELFDLKVHFSEPLVSRFDFVELDAFIDPEPLSGPITEYMSLEDGGRTVVFHDIQLVPGGSRLTIAHARGESGLSLPQPLSLPMVTEGADANELDLASIRGSVAIVGDELHEAAVFIYDPASSDMATVAGAVVEADGTFTIEDMVGGVYAAYAQISTVTGNDLHILYDPDGDGEPDPVEIGGGQAVALDFELVVEALEEMPPGDLVQLTSDGDLDMTDPAAVEDFSAALAAEIAAALGIDPERVLIVDVQAGSIVATVLIVEDETGVGPAAAESAEALADLVADNPEALPSAGTVLEADTSITAADLPGAAGPNMAAALSLDLDAAPGDQGLTSLEARGGETIDVAVYAYGTADLTGVSVSVAYDTTQVVFEEALEAPAGEFHLLRAQAGAIPLFRPPELLGNAVESGGTILSPTASTVARGDGPVALLRFRTLDDYTGASIILEQTSLSSLGGAVDTHSVGLAGLLSPPLDLVMQSKGQVSFDFDTAQGDGELFHLGLVTPEEEVSVELYVNDVTDLVNYSIKVSFDPDQLSYVTYVENPFLGGNGGLAIGLTSPPSQSSGLGAIEAGASILGAQAGQGVTGSFHVGTLTFTTAASFSTTDLLVTEYTIRSYGGEQLTYATSIFGRISTQELAFAKLSADFNSDGVVNFGDFFLFADAFAVTPVDRRFDLNSDGAVDFGDFFLFADAFGSSGKQIALRTVPTRPGEMGLRSVSTDDGIELLLTAEHVAVRSYRAEVEFDPAAFRLVEVTDAGSAMEDGGTALLLSEESPGLVTVSGSRTGRSRGVEGVVARLEFAPLRPEASGLFRMANALVRRDDGLVVQLRDLGEVEARLLPTSYGLEANYPNPFNPSTAIRYRLPDAARTRLVIYDVLGQRVRTLVDAVQSAGFHQAVWMGRDDVSQPVAAGVYFYRLEVRTEGDGNSGAAGFAATRKLTLVK